MFGDFAAVLGILHSPISADHEHRAAEAAVELAATDQYAVVFAKFGAAMGTQSLHFVNVLSATPSLLTKRQV